MRASHSKTVGKPAHLETLAIYGAALSLGFAVAFALAWFFPEMGLVLLVAPLAHFAFARDFSRKSILRLAVVLILTCVAVFAAAAMQ